MTYRISGKPPYLNFLLLFLFVCLFSSGFSYNSAQAAEPLPITTYFNDAIKGTGTCASGSTISNAFCNYVESNGKYNNYILIQSDSDKYYLCKKSQYSPADFFYDGKTYSQTDYLRSPTFVLNPTGEMVTTTGIHLIDTNELNGNNFKLIASTKIITDKNNITTFNNTIPINIRPNISIEPYFNDAIKGTGTCSSDSTVRNDFCNYVKSNGKNNNYILVRSDSDKYYLALKPKDAPADFFYDGKTYSQTDYLRSPTFVLNPTGEMVTTTGIHLIDTNELNGNYFKLIASTMDITDKNNNITFEKVDLSVYNWPGFIKDILSSLSIFNILNVLLLAVPVCGLFFLMWFGVRKITKLIIISIKKGKVGV